MQLQMAWFHFLSVWVVSILCVYKHMHLLYPFISRWTIRLSPCLGYCKFCCYKHRGVWIFSSYSFFPGICSGLELLDHMETLFLLFLRKCHTVFHSGCTSLHSPNSVRGFPSSAYPLQHVIYQLSNGGHSDRSEVVPPCSVDLPFLLISNAEHLFICLLAICISCFKPQISAVRVTSTYFV